VFVLSNLKYTPFSPKSQISAKMSLMKDDTYIFISRSGGGKGTQIALLKQYFEDNDMGQVFHMEAGDRFRNFFAQKTYSSKLAKEISNKGGLLPSFLAIWGWSVEFIEHADKDNILIIDGTPRKLDEAKILNEALEFYGRTKVKVVLIDISREWAIKRMEERRREDDKDIESRTKRLDWFDSDVVPVLKYFEEHPNYEVIKVNGEQSIKEVHDEVLDKIR
jgi:adenylate kinase family enzyme